MVQRKEAPKNVARVIEVQSDLFQAGKETNPRIKAMDRQLDISKIRTNSDNIISVLMYLKDDVRSSNIIKDYIQEMKEALIQYKKMRKVSTDMAEAI